MAIYRSASVFVVAMLMALTQQSAQAFVNGGRGKRAVAITSPSRLQLMNFFNEGKKALVKSLAGDYDQAAIRERLDSLITESPVLMLSFET